MEPYSADIVPLPPRRALEELRKAIIPEYALDAGYVVELSILAKNDNVNVREFNSYLGLIDNTYGRLSYRGLRSYAHTHREQLKISSIKASSIELILSEAVTELDSTTRLIVIYLMLRYLPHSWAAAYRDYEEGRFTRARRQSLRRQIQNDEELATLDHERKNQLVRFLDSCYQRERQTPKAREFDSRYIEEITIRFERKEDDS